MNKAAQELGKLGGKKTISLYGKEHMKKISLLGVKNRELRKIRLWICECDVPGIPSPEHGECSKCGKEIMDRDPVTKELA